MSKPKAKKPRRSSTPSRLPIRRRIEPGTPGQVAYHKSLCTSDIVIVDGPAGTGKTFLAAGVAVHSIVANLDRGDDLGRRKIIITRPAVEAGERLGFAPGSIDKKMAQWVAPMFEAIKLHSRDEDEYRRLTGPEGIVQIVPFATMRGWTFRDSWVILDEAQNTTPHQMEMFLGRMGEGSRLVIAGNVRQSDLPRYERHSGRLVRNGLELALEFEGRRFERGKVAVHRLTLADIMRHDLIAEVLTHVEEIHRGWEVA